MQRTKAQNKKLYMLLNDTGLIEQKDELVHDFTHGRTHHSSAMSQTECAELINYLNAFQQRNKPEVRKDVMRKKILSMAHEIGWETASGEINWQRLNKWLSKYGYEHKHLNAYTYDELTKLVGQFEEGPYKFYMQKLAS